MALNTLNSVGGFSVGVSEAEVISANGNISTGNLTVNTAGVVNFTTTSNVALGNVSNLHISGGTANYVLSTDGSGTLSWVAQAGGGAISNISNGNSNVSIPVANGNVNISAVGNANVVVITGTGANITGTANITGNLTAGNIIAGSGSGGNITNANVISANTFTATGNVTGGNLTTSGALSVTGNANVGNIGAAAGVFTTVAGTLTTAAQPNITSVGTLTSLSVTGTATAGNLSTGGTLTATGNANVGNLGTGGLVVATGNVTGGNLTTSGALSVIGNANTGNLGTTTLIATTGNITTINSGLIQNGNSNIAITSNGNVSIQAAGSTVELVVTSTGANISGTLNATGNANVGNIGAAEGVFTTVAGTLTTAAQPNITSVGSLSGLTVSNATGIVNFTTTANVTLGAVANLHIAGGSNGQYLQTDGAGTLTWSTVTSGSTSNISNGNSNVSIPVANGNINFSAVGNANVVVVTGTGVNVAGTLNVTGQSNLGAVGNVVITGGTANYVLSTDGSGNLSWVAGGGTAANVTVDNFTGNGVQTIFTLSTTPIGINQTSVNYNGATVLRTDYTLANANITFSSAPANGSYIEVTTINLSSGGGGGTPGGTNTQVQFNDANSFGGNTGFTFNKTTTTVTANNFVATSTANLGSNANVIITGGTANYVLSTDGVGNLSWVAQSGGGGTPGGTNTQVQFNDANSFAGNTGFTFNKTTGVFSAPSLSVAGNANLGNLVEANYFAGNGANLSGITGANVTGEVANANYAAYVGNVVTAAQPNITSVGTLSSLTATGNIQGGNIQSPGSVTATGNIQSNATVVTDAITGHTTGVTITAVGTNQNINLVPTGTGKVNVGNFIISNVATPVASSDAATKQYVDDIAQGLHTHDSCNAATQTTLATISGGTVTYNNGASGVGANLVTTGTYTTIDGVTLSVGMRVLVKNEANTAHNGIYDLSSTTVLTRSSDFDTPTEMAGGDFTFVTAGTLYDNTGWVMPDPVTTVGTSPVVWVQFSGAGTYTAGTGLSLNGNEFSIANTTVTAGSYGNGDSVATFTVNGQGQLSAAANVAITANAANLTGTTLASGVTTSSLTSVGTLGSLSVTGNITGGNLTTGGSLSVSGVSNLGPVSNVIITGGTANYVLRTDGAGNLTWVAQSGGGGGGTPGGANTQVQFNDANSFAGNTGFTFDKTTGVFSAPSLSVTGNANTGNLDTTTAIITTGNITTINSGLMQNGNSNVTITANGNVTFNAVGGARIIATSTGANVTGTLGVSGNITGANLVTGGLITVTGNITGGNIVTAGAITATGNGTFGNIAGGNIVTANFVQGVLTTASQPNITSVGTLSSLTATGNIQGGNLTTGGSLSVSGVSNLGPVGNVKITGGTVNYVLRTDGAGNLSWAAPNIPPNDQTSAYVLVASDAGKYINITTGGVTVPNSVFTSGDTLSIYNNSAANQTITQGSGVTMYQVGTAVTGNRTLAQRGLATLLCVGANIFVITGGGLT